MRARAPCCSVSLLLAFQAAPQKKIEDFLHLPTSAAAPREQIAVGDATRARSSLAARARAFAKPRRLRSRHAGLSLLASSPRGDAHRREGTRDTRDERKSVVVNFTLHRGHCNAF